MTDTTVSPAEAADQPETATPDERARGLESLRDFVDFLDRNPWAPMPYLDMQADLQRHSADIWRGGAEGIAELRRIAEVLGEKPNENANDRTQVTRRFGSVEYRVITWHKDGRPGEPDERDIELEKLRAEVAELRAAVPAGALDGDDGLGYSREADDPTPVSPARVPLHTGGMVGPVDGGTLVDETVPGLIVGDTAAEQRDNAYAAYERDEAEYLPNCPECMGQHHTIEPCR